MKGIRQICKDLSILSSDVNSRARGHFSLKYRNALIVWDLCNFGDLPLCKFPMATILNTPWGLGNSEEVSMQIPPGKSLPLPSRLSLTTLQFLCRGGYFQCLDLCGQELRSSFQVPPWGQEMQDRKESWRRCRCWPDWNHHLHRCEGSGKLAILVIFGVLNPNKILSSITTALCPFLDLAFDRPPNFEWEDQHKKLRNQCTDFWMT